MGLCDSCTYVSTSKTLVNFISLKQHSRIRHFKTNSYGNKGQNMYSVLKISEKNKQINQYDLKPHKNDN